MLSSRIFADFLAHVSHLDVRYLLHFGEPSDYLGYTAMSDFFPRYTMKPNPQCDNGHCIQAQQKHQEWLTLNPDVPKPEVTKAVTHEENEWGICVVDDSDSIPTDVASGAPTGASYEFERPSTDPIPEEDKVHVADEEDLASLMGQLSSLSSKN